MKGNVHNSKRSLNFNFGNTNFIFPDIIEANRSIKPSMTLQHLINRSLRGEGDDLFTFGFTSLPNKDNKTYSWVD